MTKQDYINWAEDYRRQADVLTEKINRLYERRRRPFGSAWERKDAEMELDQLIDMRLECRCTMKRLLKQAEEMEGEAE